MTTLGKHRKAVAATAVVLGGVLALGACGSSGGDGGDDAKNANSEAHGKKSSEARIKIASKDGSEGASINNGGNVQVSKGKLTAVSLTAVEGGTTVDGTISDDGTSWKPDRQLERATQYKITAKAKDSGGRKAVENSTFTTVSPDNSFIGTYTGEDGQSVGVGMPVSINFDKSIANKKAVQSAIKVNSTSGQEVVGHWFGDNRLDFRPEDYWKPGSKVTLALKLDGVKGGPNMTGVQNKSVSFNIGRSQVSTVDAAKHTMTVVRDGKKLKTIPISAGSAKNPTYNGKMVISEKHKETRMDGNTVGFGRKGEEGYDIKDVPHAMRLSTSGTFIHGNYWGAPFGSGNTSHGCVGLKDARGAGDNSTDGAWFYSNSMIGDVVEVKGSPDKTVQPDNGLNGWNMSWAEWKAGSAV
ncbi:lipoprotein-anchoring transpeptidase ErfK/SrfK [Streptomyces sp. Amel2xB2]|uniref:L,D-transpeptidase n=1 Tax=Streptomyces sp. Amel2xB2 TaxID=1305829 RepID=UPI000DB9D50D|nr:Ig-like domain-containing protein [Streptomyces sp. Amel2xB2]RAJ71670.1 lipoprotein-anchoring transpeptidase ErfK/SrfK [Streptomyces sp. Amel2xB2]